MSDTTETDAEVNECKSSTTYNMVWSEFARKLERERNGYYDELLTKRGLCKIQERAIDDWKAEAELWRSLAQGWKEEAVEQIKETTRLVEGIRAELRKNAHLADGDDCTLIGLKQLIGHEEGAEL